MSDILPRRPEWDVENGDGESEQPSPANLSGKAAPAVAQVAKPASVPNMVPQIPALHSGSDKATVFKKGTLGPEYSPEFSEVFPDDYKGAMAVLYAVDKLPVRNRAEHDEKMRRRKIIGKHIHILQNGSPAPHIGGHEFGGLQAQRNGRAAYRCAHIEKLKGAKTVLADAIKPMPAPELLGMTDAGSDEDALSLLSLAPKARLLAHADVGNLLALARVAAIDAELFRLENYDLLHPEEAIEEIERELRGSTNPARVRELQTRLAGMKETGASHKAGQLALRGEVEKLWGLAFKYLELLQSVAGKLCNEWGLDAVLAEKDFFSRFGLPLEQTALSRRFRIASRELEVLPVNRNTIFAWFGVSDLAETN